MSYVDLNIHAVWRTKRSEQVLLTDARKKILDHIRENAAGKKIYIDTINAEPDHVHCLFKLNASMSLSKALNLIKGESSNWANKTGLFSCRFEWAVDYYAASVSHSILDSVRAYIINQEAHHKKVSFEEEYKELMNTIMSKRQA